MAPPPPSRSSDSSKTKRLDVSFGTSSERRLQTLAVLFFVSLIPLVTFLHLVSFVMIFIPLFTIPMLVYLGWIHFIDTAPISGSRKPVLRKLAVWKYFVDYFPIKLVKTAELDPENKYVFGYHPHGIISMGAFGCFGTDGAGFSKLFPGIDIRLLTLPINFRTPFLRELLLSLGACNSSQKACQTILAKGKGSAIMLVVGGAEEALSTAPGKHDLVLHKRQGFVRQAIRAGAHLVPCFAFGENDLYNTHSFPEGSLMYKLQEFGKRTFSFSMPIFHGRGVFLRNVPLFLPFRKPVTVVVGSPIAVPQVDKSIDLVKSEEGRKIVNEVHAQYEEALQKLFNEHKDKLARERASSLKFVQ